MRENKKHVKKTLISIITIQILLTFFIITIRHLQPLFICKISNTYANNQSKVFYVYHSGKSYIDPVDPKGEKCLIPWDYTNDITKAKLIMYNVLDNDNMISKRRDHRLRPDQATCIESMESASYYPSILRNKGSFNYSMLYSLTSDVPIPYSECFETNEKPLKLFQKQSNLIAMFISNCYAKNDRIDYIKQLMKYIKIDSYGRCLNNAKVPNRWKRKTRDKTKEEVISHYKFTIAFENSNDYDYITEKLFQPLRFGSVPIFRGCPNVEDFAPPNSFIDSKKFESPQKLAEYIKFLDTHNNEYKKYLEWKKKNDLGNLAKILFFRDRYESGVCALIERMHGLWINPFLTDWNRMTHSDKQCVKCLGDFNLSNRRVPKLRDDKNAYDYPLNSYWMKIIGNKPVGLKNDKVFKNDLRKKENFLQRFAQGFFSIF